MGWWVVIIGGRVDNAGGVCINDAGDGVIIVATGGGSSSLSLSLLVATSMTQVVVAASMMQVVVASTMLVMGSSSLSELVLPTNFNGSGDKSKGLSMTGREV